MRISAKADYAVRAALELAAAPDGEPVKVQHLAEAQDLPLQFLEHILLELKHARLVRAKRGARGGYWLARPPDDITIADVIRAVDGPLANVQDSAPEDTAYPGPSENLQDGWLAVRANGRGVRGEGPLANVQDSAPEDTASPGPAEKLQDVWVAVRANLRAVLEQVTLADVRDDALPEPIGQLVADPDAWGRR